MIGQGDTMKRPLYVWLRKTKSRRVLAAILVTVLLAFMHFINAWWRMWCALRRDCSACVYNVRLIWTEFVPKGNVDEDAWRE